MKVAIIAIGLLLSSVAFASEGHTPSSTPTPTDTSLYLKDDNTQRQPWGYGIGTDIVLYKPAGVLDEITAEGRWDVENREVRGFLVARIDPYKWGK